MNPFHHRRQRKNTQTTIRNSLSATLLCNYLCLCSSALLLLTSPVWILMKYRAVLKASKVAPEQSSVRTEMRELCISSSKVKEEHVSGWKTVKNNQIHQLNRVIVAQRASLSDRHSQEPQTTTAKNIWITRNVVGFCKTSSTRLIKINLSTFQKSSNPMFEEKEKHVSDGWLFCLDRAVNTRRHNNRKRTLLGCSTVELITVRTLLSQLYIETVQIDALLTAHCTDGHIMMDVVVVVVGSLKENNMYALILSSQ